MRIIRETAIFKKPFTITKVKTVASLFYLTEKLRRKQAN